MIFRRVYPSRRNLFRGSHSIKWLGKFGGNEKKEVANEWPRGREQMKWRLANGYCESLRCHRNRVIFVAWLRIHGKSFIVSRNNARYSIRCATWLIARKIERFIKSHRVLTRRLGICEIVENLEGLFGTMRHTAPLCFVVEMLSSPAEHRLRSLHEGIEWNWGCAWSRFEGRFYLHDYF